MTICPGIILLTPGSPCSLACWDCHRGCSRLWVYSCCASPSSAAYWFHILRACRDTTYAHGTQPRTLSADLIITANLQSGIDTAQSKLALITYSMEAERSTAKCISIGRMRMPGRRRAVRLMVPSSAVRRHGRHNISLYICATWWCPLGVRLGSDAQVTPKTCAVAVIRNRIKDWSPVAK